MKALTVRQPWAECIARGEKLIENRTRGTSYRGPLAIHAGKADDRAAWPGQLIRQTLGSSILRPDLDYGAVIAIVDLVDVHESNGICCGPWAQHAYDAKLSVAYHRHLVLDRVRRLTTPIPARGALGLWEIDDQLIARADVTIPAREEYL